MDKRDPCRLAVFPALHAPTAAVLRRGPTQWAHLSIWDRETDRVEHGQWFRGRIYARRCDLSPRGDLFVYFAAKHGRADEDGLEAWTGLSRPPWLTALSLWENLGSWYGGGAFTPERRSSASTLPARWRCIPDFKTPTLRGPSHRPRHRALGSSPASPTDGRWRSEDSTPAPISGLGQREVWSRSPPSDPERHEALPAGRRLGSQPGTANPVLVHLLARNGRTT